MASLPDRSSEARARSEAADGSGLAAGTSALAPLPDPLLSHRLLPFLRHADLARLAACSARLRSLAHRSSSLYLDACVPCEESLRALGRCPPLSRLHLRVSHPMQPLLSSASFADRCSTLNSLSISVDFSNPPDISLEVPLGCALLSSLSLSGLPGLSDRCLRSLGEDCPLLRRLSLEFLPRAVAPDLSSCSFLEALSLRHMFSLRSLAGLPPRLLSLSLLSCDLSALPPLPATLATLSLSHCSSLLRLSLGGGSAPLPVLRSLSLRCLGSLDELRLAAPSLREFALVECPALRSLVLDAAELEALSLVHLTVDRLELSLPRASHITLIGLAAVADLSLELCPGAQIESDDCDEDLVQRVRQAALSRPIEGRRAASERPIPTPRRGR